MLCEVSLLYIRIIQEWILLSSFSSCECAVHFVLWSEENSISLTTIHILCYVYALLHPHLEREFYNLCNRFTFIEKKSISISDSNSCFAFAAALFLASTRSRRRKWMFNLFILCSCYLTIFHLVMHRFPLIVVCQLLAPHPHITNNSTSFFW